MNRNFTCTILLNALALIATTAVADPNLEQALRRTQYLLNATVPTDNDYLTRATSDQAYRDAVRGFLEHPNFYDAMLRYHEVLYGTGLQADYLTELERNDIDNKQTKIAKITCARADAGNGGDGRYRCFFASADAGTAAPNCPTAWEQAVTAFWYPGIVAWACPAVVSTCGSDLSRCFIQYNDQNAALYAEFGTTEIFDTSVDVVKSLSKQSAGIATAVVVANYPYTKILEPGLTAVDGAIAHFLRQSQFFDLQKLNLPTALMDTVNQMPLATTHYQLVNTGPAYDQAGVLSTFGWLRRYEKDRSRANQLYQRFLCRQFTSALPRVFPADPGNLRTTPGCMGCHSTLDPLADFFKVWGEGGELYTGGKNSVATAFGGHDGQYLSDLADIIRNDNAFATCQVEHAWNWLMGRSFYRDEADLRAALTNYFVTTNFSFKELLYAIATHPGYIAAARTDATVGDPLEEPPLGQPPGGNSDLPCNATINFTADIVPKLAQCTNCHSASSGTRQDLSTSTQWQKWGDQAVTMMASGNMPPGQAGPPRIGPVWDLKEAARCWREQTK